jgi:GNAT superfamily N-acetyltransferase
MIRLKEEKLSSELIQEIYPLLAAHWEEIADNKDKIKLNPDFQWYWAQEKAGALHIVTARDDGELKGYFISVVHPNPHYKDHIFAVNDILFVHPDFRGTTLPVRMFKYAEEKLRQRGVSVMSLHMKTKHPFVGFAEKLGFRKAEYNFTKWIGG